jgi:hypothetical protein
MKLDGVNALANGKRRRADGIRILEIRYSLLVGYYLIMSELDLVCELELLDFLREEVKRMSESCTEEDIVSLLCDLVMAIR